MRRVAILFIALLAVSETGCCGQVRSFFYRVFHCPSCTPYYGYGGAAPSYSGPVYGGAPGCSTCATPSYSPVPAMPASYSMPANSYPTAGQPVFGQSTPLPAPSVHTNPGTGIPTPMAEKK
ncbi:hypothetical protein BH11PLA2_BH11PLA2_50480 [soil metagenome]